MKKIFLLLLSFLAFNTYAQAEFPESVQLTNSTDNTALKVNVQNTAGVINTIAKVDLIEYLEFASAINLPTTGVSGKLYLTKDNNTLYRWNGTIYVTVTVDVSGKENISNKQNSLVADGTGVKYPTVDAIRTHTTDLNNPHAVTKTQVGLSNVDNTSDVNKPISTAEQTALNNKVTSNTSIVGATNTKITYDAKGLVTAGTSLIASDIPNIAQSQVTNLVSDLALKAPLASPALTGVPTAPTPPTSNSSTQIATTAFVNAFSGPLISHLEFNNTNKTVWNNGLNNLSFNTAFGEGAMEVNTTGNNNSIYGFLALGSNTVGSNNIAMGQRAGFSSNSINGFNNLGSTKSVFLGGFTAAKNNNTSNTNEIVIGYEALGEGSNSVTLGNTEITLTRLRGSILAGSSVTTSSATITNLSGTGSRVVTADASGNLSAATNLTHTGAATFSSTITASSLDLPNVNALPATAGMFHGSGYIQIRSGTAGLLVNNNANTVSNLVVNNSGVINIPNLSGAGLRVTTSDASGNQGALGLVPLRGYTVATLPAGQQQGMTAFVTDALAPSYMVGVVAGGTVVTAVFFNGTTWISH